MQAQVLITNVIHNLKGVPRTALRALQGALAIKNISDKVGYSIRIGARLLGMSAATVTDAYRRVRDNAWRPVGPKASHGPMPKAHDEGGLSPSEDEGHSCLRNSVRVTLANAVDGGSYMDLCNVLQRMHLAGAQVHMGATGSDYAKVVVAFASMVVSHLDADDFNGDLPGLGIPSDFGILADPVSLGVGVLARHDTVCVTCLCIASRWTGRMYTPMHSAPAMPIGSHGGDEMAALILANMGVHPANWGLRALRARCAVVGGDGAICAGGPEHRHQSPAVAEKFWRKLYPNATPHLHGGGLSPQGDIAPLCTIWDAFHRIDCAVWRGIRDVPMAIRVFDKSKELDYIFGQSEGVMFFRGASAAMGGGSRGLRAPGGTRKIGHLSGTPGAILENFKVILGGLHARVAWAQNGHRNQSLEHLLGISRALTDISFVVFGCVFADILRLGVRPFVIQVQGVLDPSAFKRCERRCFRYLAQVHALLPSLRGLFRVVALLRQHVPFDDLINLVSAFRWSALGRCFPTLFHAAPNLLAQTPSYGGH